MSILQTLRAVTAPHHDRLEAAMPLMRPDLDLPTYRGVLARFYGVVAPLEAHLLTCDDWLALLPDYTERQRLPHLASDLAGLGVAPGEQAQLPRMSLPPLDSLAQTLGVMYVMEGSTLGGQHLVRHLQGQFSWEDLAHCRFFNSYGPLVGPRWKGFCQTLEQFSEQHPEQQPMVVEAATGMFGRFSEWFTSQSNTPLACA